MDDDTLTGVDATEAIDAPPTEAASAATATTDLLPADSRDCLNGPVNACATGKLVPCLDRLDLIDSSRFSIIIDE